MCTGPWAVCHGYLNIEKYSLVVFSSVSKKTQGLEFLNLLHRFIWERSTESSDAYPAMTYISGLVEHRKIYSPVAYSSLSK